MIQDDDEQTIERVHEEIYDPKYADESIFQLMNQAYNALDLNDPKSDYKVVEVNFKLLFEQPLKISHVRSEKGSERMISEFVCSVGFYAFEYRDMLESMKPKTSLKFLAYRYLGLNPIVEKTKNNFTFKAHEKGIHIQDIRDVRFLVTKA